MKHHTLLITFSFLVITCYSQQRVEIPSELKNRTICIDERTESVILSAEIPGEKRSLMFSPQNINWELVEAEVGSSKFDLQTNGLAQKRIFKFDDGTIGTVWTMGFEDASFPDRGTGYNYFDGFQWGSQPTSIIESERSGWPSYAPWGENGEIVCSHNTNDTLQGLLINRREEKGTGDWIEVLYQGPVNPYNPTEKLPIYWPSMFTGGIDHQTIHLLVRTAPAANGGVPYFGQDGALLYSRSNDGGDSWNIEHHLFPELDSSQYSSLQPDSYVWAEPKGETIAFLVSSRWMDAVLMKSDDNGDSWTKTIIWQHPYPMWEAGGGIVTDTFYCPDNSGSISLDNAGKAHVVFGITRLQHNGSVFTYFPFTDGIVYWNEDMPSFSNNPNALNPTAHPDSELEVDYNLIGWTQDVNNNGEINLLWDVITYKQLGISTMPQIVCSENQIYVLYSSTTETYDNGIWNYKHLWVRISPNNGEFWGSFLDLTQSGIHVFDECIYPVLSSYIGGFQELITFQYNLDSEPGLAVSGDHNYFDNSIQVAYYDKGVGIATKNTNPVKISDCFPNPAVDYTSIKIESEWFLTIQMNISSISGKLVEQITITIPPGTNRINCPLSNYQPGIYLIELICNGYYEYRKLIIK